MNKIKTVFFSSVRGRLLLFNLLVMAVTLMVSSVAILGFIHASQLQEQMRQQTLDDMKDSMDLARNTASVVTAAIRLTQVVGAPEYQQEKKRLKETQASFEQALNQLAKSPVAQQNAPIVARIILHANTLQQSVSGILQQGQRHHLVRTNILSSLYQNQSYLRHLQDINQRTRENVPDAQLLNEMDRLIIAAIQTSSPVAIIRQLNKITPQFPKTASDERIAFILPDFIHELYKLKPLAQQLEDSSATLNWHMYHIKALVGFLNQDINQYVEQVTQASQDRTLHSHQKSRFIIMFITAFAMLALMITGFAGWYIYRHFGSNLTAISRAMSQLAQGEQNISVPALQRSDELGDLARAFNIFSHNIISLKRTTQLLKEKTAQLETTFHSMRDGFALFDKQNRLVVWNPQYPLLLGLTAEDLQRGQHYQNLLSKVAAQPQYVQENHCRTLAKSQELRLADNRTIELRLSPLPGQGMVNAVLDRTERKNLEEALLHSQKMKAVGQLTGGLAHDFNNLLSVIIGSLELVSSNTPDAPRISRALKAAERGALLTQRLLVFSRKQSLSPRSTEVNPLLENLRELMRHSLPATIGLEIEVRCGTWPAWIDTGQLENAIINLVMNARDAMEGQNGSITIRSWNQRVTRTGGEKQDMVTVEVIDHGCGMLPEIKEQVFEPFFTTKQPGNGSGLGLSMVYGFVRQSGGRIQIESAPGQGTRVRLQLPRAASQAVEYRQTETVPDSKNTGQLVLVVEDETDVRQMLCEQLHQSGYLTLEAEDGAQALQILQASADIQVLISDLMLTGELNGVDVINHARRYYPHLYVLLISGQDLRATENLTLPDVEFLRKPFSHRQLIRALNRNATRLAASSAAGLQR